MCKQRHLKGEQKYGSLTFLNNSTLEMAMEEVVDLANYARYTFIKLVILQYQIKQIQRQSLKGADGFFPTSLILGVQEDI